MAEKRKIIVHCSATPPSWMEESSPEAKVAEIRRWHVEERGWRDIAYAEVIDRDGTRVKGRDLDGDGDTWEEIGAHTYGENDDSIGICLIGGHGSRANDDFHDHFTKAQEVSLLQAIDRIHDRYGPLAVEGHNDYAAKACPGFDVDRWLAGAPPARTSPAQSSTIVAAVVSIFGAGGAALTSAAGGMAGALMGGILIVVVILASLLIIGERMKKWRAGDR